MSCIFVIYLVCYFLTVAMALLLQFYNRSYLFIHLWFCFIWITSPNGSSLFLNFIIKSYGTKIPSQTLANRLSSYVHYFTLHGALRPFGASTLVAAYDQATKKHSLHMVEPSGVSYEYFGAAAGRGRQPARTEMEKLAINPKNSGGGGGDGDDDGLITCEEGVKQLAKIIYTLHDEAKDKPFELEMSWLSEGTGWKHQGVPKNVIAEATEWAKKEIEEAEEESEDDDDDEMEE